MKSEMSRLSQDRKSSGESPKGSGLPQKTLKGGWRGCLCIGLQLLALARKG